MKDAVVDYEELHQSRRDGHSESAYAELRPHQHVQDSSTNDENSGNYSVYIIVGRLRHGKITDSSLKCEQSSNKSLSLL